MLRWHVAIVWPGLNRLSYFDFVVERMVIECEETGPLVWQQHCLISCREGLGIVKKNTPKFTKVPSLVLIKLTLNVM